MQTFPILTKRLHLRNFENEDFDCLSQLYSLPEISRYEEWGDMDPSELQNILEYWVHAPGQEPRIDYSCAICLKEGTFIGVLELALKGREKKIGSIGGRIHPDCWSQGYFTEALFAILDLGFHTLKLHRIEASSHVENHPPLRVLEKAGRGNP